MRQTAATTILTVIGSVAMTLFLLYLLTSRSVSDAILNFCFAGVVPGSNRVIAPETLLRAEIILLGIVISGLGIWLCIYLYKRHYQKPVNSGPQQFVEDTLIVVSRLATSNPPTYQASEVPEAAKSLARLPAHTMRRTNALWTRAHLTNVLRASAHLARTLVQLLHQNLQRYSMTLVRIISGVSQTLHRCSIRLYIVTASATVWLGYHVPYYIRRVARYSTRAVGTISLYLAAITMICGRQAQKASKQLWRQSLPYLQRFDTWLELQYRAAISWLVRYYQHSERLQFTALSIRPSLQSLQRSLKSLKKYKP